MQAAVQQRLAAPLAGARRCAARSGLRVQAAAITDGARVRVKAPVKVFHSGKFKGGLDLQGKEATVIQADVRNYRHHDGKEHVLSANLTVKVQFMVPGPEGKDVKVIAHMDENEIELVA